MKKLVSLLLFLSIHSYGQSHAEMYQKQIDFYKRMYEQEKARTELIERNFTKIKKVNERKILFTKYEKLNDDILFFIRNSNDYVKRPFNYFDPIREYNKYYNGYIIYSSPIQKHRYLTSYNSMYDVVNDKITIQNANHKQNLNDLADLIEEYQPNTAVEIDDNYDVYINGELLE